MRRLRCFWLKVVPLGLEVIRVSLLGEVLAVYAADRRCRTGRLSTTAAGQHTLEYPIPRDKAMIEGADDVYTDRDQYRPRRPPSYTTAASFIVKRPNMSASYAASDTQRPARGCCRSRPATTDTNRPVRPSTVIVS